MADISRLPEVIFEFTDELDNDETGITVGADETDKMSMLDKMCDYYNVGMSHQIKLLNYRNVLEFLLKWKAKYIKLAEGEYTIAINETGSACHISIKNTNAAQEIKVEATNAAPDISVEDSKELVCLFTTPLYFQEQQHPQGRLNNPPCNWFPLPFFLPEADAF